MDDPLDSRNADSLDATIEAYQRLTRQSPVERDMLYAARWGTWTAAVSASVAIAGQAEGAVQYFAPPSPLRAELLSNATGTAAFNVDIDNDGVDDVGFEFAIQSSMNESTQVIRKGANAFGVAPGAKILGSNYAAKLLPNSSVSSLRQFMNRGLVHELQRVVTSTASSLTGKGEFGPAETGLVGARFEADALGAATEHFAWLRVRTDFDGDLGGAFEVIDWAYDDDPLQTILAGDTTGPVALLGDYDSSGVVDNADYGIWSNAFGSEQFPGEGADGNGNGLVDAADYTVWRDAISQSSSGAVVPEPTGSALALLALGAVGVGKLLTQRLEERSDGAEPSCAGPHNG